MSEGDLTANIGKDYQGSYADCKNNINSTLLTLSNCIIPIRDAADFIDTAFSIQIS